MLHDFCVEVFISSFVLRWIGLCGCWGNIYLKYFQPTYLENELFLRYAGLAHFKPSVYVTRSINKQWLKLHISFLSNLLPPNKL